MGRVAGVFDNPPGFPCTPPGVDILEGGKLTSNNVAGSSHDPLQSPAVASGAVSLPGGDTRKARRRISGLSGDEMLFFQCFVESGFYVLCVQRWYSAYLGY